jgi:hypothetical protein
LMAHATTAPTASSTPVTLSPPVTSSLVESNFSYSARTISHLAKVAYLVSHLREHYCGNQPGT